MTIAPLSPSPSPLLCGAVISPATATLRRPQLSAPPSTAKTPIAHDKTTLPILHMATKTNAAVITQPSSVFENRKITAYTAPKSP